MKPLSPTTAKANRLIMNEIQKLLSSKKGIPTDEIRKELSEFLESKTDDITQLYDEEGNTSK